MSSTEALELGKILVDIPVKYRAVKELLIRDHANEYGSLSLTLILTETVEEDVMNRLEGQNIRILTPDGKGIFAGICSGTGLRKENRYAELHVEAKSHAWITDRTPKSRTFQSAQKTLLQVAQAVMGDYPAVLRVKQDMPISWMLSQQEETDWQFLKRIANQCGLLLFTNVKSTQPEIHIGTIPFSAKALQLTGVYEKKDIAACLRVKLNTRKEASVYEFLQTGGSCEDLTAGSGSLVRGKNADCIITESDIRSDRGVLYNHVLLTYSDGAVPRMEEAYAGSSPSYTSVLTGKVLQVSGTDIQVQFDDGAGGVRWIPYTSALGNDIYAMPDENDTVFCYYDNSGEIVALGSKAVDTSYPDFEKPEERSLTAYNRMIKFKGDGIDLTGNRAEYDGKGGNQVKITFSDTEGIDIAASGDIHIGGQKTVLIQAKELPEGETMPTAWFDESFSENMDKFKAQQQEGSNKYVADKGAFKPYDPVTDLVCTVGGSFVDGFVEELKSPMHIFESFGSLIDMVKGEDEEEMPKVQFAAVEDKRVSAIALESLYLIVGDSGIIIGKDYIMIDAQRFQQSGFERKTDYPEVSESQRTGMDIFMDFAKLAVDIACLFCPALWGLKLVSAGISLLKGDYYGAAMSLIPFSSAFKAVDGVVDAVKTANKVTKAITVIIAGAEITASTLDAGMAIARIYQNFKKNGWDALTDLAMWDDLLCVGQSTQSICGSVKDIAEVTEKPKTNNTPEGDTNKEGDAPETPEQNRQQTEADPGKPENATDCGDPIDVVTGSQKVYQTEFVIRDISGSFAIRRYYESIYKNSGSLLGERWYLSVGSYLTVREDRAVILLPNRHLERFVRRQDGTWENLRGSDGSVTLREKDRQYLLHCRKEEKTYHYDFDGKLVSIEDRNGNQIRLKYMGAVLVEMDFPSGQMLSFAYEDGKLSSMTDIIGRQVQYRYEGELLTEVTYPNGGTITYAYTPEGYLCGITDQNGNPYVRNEYTRDGRVTRQFLNGDTEYVILYDDNNRVNTFLNMTNNDRLEFHYNSSRLVVKTVYSDGSSEEARYDERENKAWEKDRRGYELTRRFNTDSMLLEENLPSGLTTCFAYDENGSLSRKWDNGGKKQWYTYDRHGNPVEILQEITEGVMQRVRFSYDDRGRITEILDANGNATRYTYEGTNPQPSAITTPEEHTLRYTYDKAGRCMEITGEQGTTGYAYNHMDCVTMVTNPLGEVTRYYYDALCNLTKVVKPNQTGENGSYAGMQYIYDQLDAVIMTIDPLGNVRATPRDVEGNILKEIHPNAYDARTGDGEGICYEYDVFNNRTRIRYPDGGVERICYDAMGHITRKIAPLEYDETRDDGRGWSYTYDEVGRLTQITDPEGTVQKRYVYDLHGNIVKLITAESYLQGETDEERPGVLYGYNALGWLTEVRKPVKTEEDGRVLYQLTQYRYDPAGNMIREIRYRDYQTRESAAGAVHTISYEYDKDNRRIRVSDCTGAAVEYRYDSANRRIYEKRRINDTTDQIFTYAYDAAGRLTEVRQSADEEGCGRKMTATAYEYDHNGNLTRIRLPYGAEIRREYDAADRITAEHHLEKATGIRTTTYFTYDKADNLTAIRDNAGRTVSIAYNLLNQEVYRTEKDGGVTGRCYDLNGRLSSLIRPNEYACLGDQAHGEQYTYDSLGRLLEVTRPDGSLQARYTYAPSGPLTVVTDACGNGIHYTYDLGGRRTQASTQGGSSQTIRQTG